MTLHIMTLLAILGVLTGSSVTKAIGRTETKDNLVLHVEHTDGVKHVSLDGYTFMNYDKVSITADVTTDSEGSITSATNIKIVGISSKINSVSGILTDDKADIFLKGKALAVFNFEIHYTASRRE